MAVFIDSSESSSLPPSPTREHSSTVINNTIAQITTEKTDNAQSNSNDNDQNNSSNLNTETGIRRQCNTFTPHPQIIKHQDMLRQENEHLKFQLYTTEAINKHLNKKLRNITEKESPSIFSSNTRTKHRTENRPKADSNPIKSISIAHLQQQNQKVVEENQQIYQQLETLKAKFVEDSSITRTVHGDRDRGGFVH